MFSILMFVVVGLFWALAKGIATAVGGWIAHRAIAWLRRK